MSELREKLLQVKSQKDTYIIPENLKKDITTLGVTGTYAGAMSQEEYNTAISTTRAIYDSKVINLFDNKEVYEIAQSGGLNILSTGFSYKRTNSNAASLAEYKVEDLIVNSKYTISFIVSANNTVVLSHTNVYIEQNSGSVTNIVKTFVESENNTKITLTFTATATTMYISVMTAGGAFDWINFTNVMLNAGEIAEDYVAPTEDTTLQPNLNAILLEKQNKVLPQNIKAGVSILGVTGTYKKEALLFSTVVEMEAYENPTEDLYAIVYGTTYVGTYRYDGNNWTQIGDSTQEQETMDVLNDVMGTTDQYEGTGGTDEQISDVLDDILGN